LRFQSESTGCSGYTGYVITYTLEHFDTCDTVDSTVVSMSIVGDSKLVQVDNKQVVLHTQDAAVHTPAVQAHNKVCKQHNLKVLTSLLRLL
jgi:hypothetical protein